MAGIKSAQTSENMCVCSLHHLSATQSTQASTEDVENTTWNAHLLSEGAIPQLTHVEQDM